MTEKSKEEIVDIIQSKIDDVEYSNTQTRMNESFYMKNDAKLEVLQQLLTTIENL